MPLNVYEVHLSHTIYPLAESHILYSMVIYIFRYRKLMDDGVTKENLSPSAVSPQAAPSKSRYEVSSQTFISKYIMSSFVIIIGNKVTLK